MKAHAWLIPILCWLLVTARSQQPQPTGGTPESLQAAEAQKNSALGVRQQRVKRMLQDLEAKFTELSKTLGEENPEQAKRLTEAFKRSKDLLLEQRMDEIAGLLDGMKLESANDEQGKLIVDLKALVDLLLADENDLEKLTKEIQQLEAWRKALEGLIQKEGEIKKDTDNLSNKDEALKKLDEQIARADELAKKQAELNKETEEKAPKGADALEQLTEKQAELRKETSELADKIQPEEQAQSENKEPGQQALEDASQSQKAAENHMDENQTAEAQAQQAKASENLRKAAEQLKKERQRIAGMTEQEMAKELAEKQKKAAQEAEAMSKQMANSEKKSQSGEEENPNAKAQEHVESAQGEMRDAGEKLSQNQPSQASPKQGEAKEELKKAKDEVERRLNELRDQAQQEQLVKLEELFKNMLEKQKRLSRGTTDLDKSREGEEKQLKRADRIALRKLAESERGLEGEAKKAESLLVDDGTSIVFRDMVGWLAKELANVSQLMEESRTDDFVQNSQKEIETALEEFLKALENAQQQQQANKEKEGQQGEGGEQRKQNLLPPIAELKLLKLNQERINRRTQAFDKERAAKELSETMKQHLAGVASMQDKLTNMTRQLATKFKAPGPNTEGEID